MFPDVTVQFAENGFVLIPDLYTPAEIAAIIALIDKADHHKNTFRDKGDLFAIRRFLFEVPGTVPLIFNGCLQALIRQISAESRFVVKGIYFDKPQRSNWYVPYHQDLKIEVDRKTALEGFSHWRSQDARFSVQPTLDILDNIFTIRIHLDDTTEENGALKVIPGSHQKGIYRPETIDWAQEQECICAVTQGGVMLMRPLLLHCSSRSTNEQRRRVIHIEMASLELPSAVQWAERLYPFL